MRAILLLALGSLLSLSPFQVLASSKNTDQQACTVLTEYLRRGFDAAQGKDAVDTLVEQLTNETRVLFLGENHRDLDSILNYPQLIQSMHARKPSLNCIWMERAEMFQSAIDGYLSGEIDSHQLFLKTCNDSCDPTLETSPDSRFASDLPLLNMAKTSGMKVFWIDEDIVANSGYLDWYLKKLMDWINGEDEEFDQDAITFVGLRNRTMTKRILGALSSGQCQSGIMIVGNRHVKHDSPTNQILSISSRLKSAGIGSSSSYGAGANVRGHIANEIPDCRPFDSLKLDLSKSKSIKNKADSQMNAVFEKYPTLKEPLSDFEMLLIPPTRP